MSVQEPQDQFERESMEDEIEESQDSLDESPLTASDAYVSSNGAEAVDVPADEPTLSSEDPAAEDESDLPPIESLPVSSSDELPLPEPTEGPAWYVIHCYSGYENKVRHNLEQRIETMGMKDRIFDVVIPTQEEIEVKDGKRRTVERHIFPGYVLVNMVLTEESWYVVRNTPGVTGFVGMGNNPTPLRPEEVAQIVKRMEAEAPTVKVTFKVGERVRIIDGPFNDFRGVVSEIDMERTKVRVMVSFFGRETPVELDFLQVEKA
jgi:transcriptional antiterminator NusG